MLSADLTALPTLETARLRLRHLTPADVPALFAVFSDPAVMRYWSSPPFADEAAAAKLLAGIEAGFQARTILQWGVARQTDNQVLGTCTLHFYGASAQNRRAEVGYALGSAHWGQGLIHEALTALVSFAFAPDGLHLHRLEADIDPRNAASARVVARLGFQQEGYLRERWLVNGEVCDTALYGLLGSEWKGKPAAALAQLAEPRG